MLIWKAASFSTRKTLSVLPTEEMMQVKRTTDEKHKSIGVLQSSGDELKQKISDLSARREALLTELKQVEEALTQA
jgi:hypothetical protein